MLDNNTLIKVTNRGLGHVGYVVPDLDVRRQFMPKETKEITMDELRKLSYQPGGRALIQHYLIIENDEAVQELLGHVEPEYNYTEEDVTKLLTEGSLDQLLDCLDFAPIGVIEMIKDIAVKIELNDMQKRQAILDKTQFNVTKAIEINHESQDEEAVEEEPKIRRAAPISEAGTTTRRTEAPHYKVVSKEE